MPLEPWGQRYKKKPKVSHSERRKTEGTGMREGCTCGHGPMNSNPTPRTVFFSRHKRKRGPLTEQNVYRIGNHIQKLTTSLLTKSAGFLSILIVMQYDTRTKPIWFSMITRGMYKTYLTIITLQRTVNSQS